MRTRRFLLASVLVLALVFAVAAAFPFVRGDMERKVLDDAARTQLPGEFVSLSDGVTHYDWAGPAPGRKVVLVHGFTSPMFVWDRQVDALAEAGFRVLRYDLYGRGFSDRPRTRYTADLFDRQLWELLDAQDIEEPVDLVGLSMGGAIVARFIDRHPERVRRFVLFAPSGFPVHVPLKYQLIKLPGVGEWLMKAIGDPVLVGGVTSRITDDPEMLASFRRQYVEQMKYSGYKRALLSTLRHNPLLNLAPVYERVGETGRPGLLFWGTDDHVVPFAHHALLREAVPGIRFHPLDGRGHTANYEAPEEVNPVLVEFLKRDLDDG